MARFTNESIARGYSIGILEYPGLNEDDASNWLEYAKNAIAMNFEGQSFIYN